MQTYSFFNRHFSGVDDLKSRITRLEHQIEQEKTKTQLAYFQAETIRQDVASLLPGKIKSKTDDYQIRNLASVLQIQDSMNIDLSKSELRKGKELFSNGKFQQAIGVFRAMIEKYPESQNIIEGYFLLSESYYQIEAMEDAIETIDVMISLFPESELTGFSLLRLAGIFIERKLPEDAKEILLTVQHNFSFNSELVAQSGQLLKRVE